MLFILGALGRVATVARGYRVRACGGGTVLLLLLYVVGEFTQSLVDGAHSERRRKIWDGSPYRLPFSPFMRSLFLHPRSHVEW